jgi:hypothetical protein
LKEGVLLESAIETDSDIQNTWAMDASIRINKEACKLSFMVTRELLEATNIAKLL